MQDDRDKRTKGAEKAYQFMLRLKSPCGVIPPALYTILDDLADQYGQGDLRATTRQAWQLHGIMKGDLKTVISTIMKVSQWDTIILFIDNEICVIFVIICLFTYNIYMQAGSSTIGACGDVSRNVMCTPAPFVDPAYKYARQYSSVLAELFKVNIGKLVLFVSNLNRK